MGKPSSGTKLRLTRWDYIIFVSYWLMVFFVQVIYNQDTHNLPVHKLIISSLFTFVIDNIAVFLIIYTLTGILFGDRPWLMAFNLLLVFGLSIVYMVFYQVLIYDTYVINQFTILGGIMNHGRSYFILAIIFSIRMIRRFHNDTLRLQLEKFKEEMKAIRGRIAPHSITNMLSLFLVQQGKRTNQELVSMIKPLMSYMLYDSQEDWLPLDKKLDFLTRYIALQKEQLPYPEILKVRIVKPVQKFKIIPGLLLPYIENTFKHSGKSKNNHISIEIYVQGSELFLLTVNTIGSVHTDLQKGGVGLRDSKRSLDLNYPNQYTYFSEANDGVYKCELSIKLDKI